MLINRMLFSLAGGVKWWIALAVLTKLVTLGASICFFYAIGEILQAASMGGVAAADLRRFLIITLTVIFIRLLMNPLTAWLSHKSSAVARLSLRQAVYQKLLQLETQYSQATGTSQAVAAAIDGVEALEAYFGAYLPQLFYALCAPVVLFSVLLAVDWHAAVVLLLVVPLLPLCLAMIMKTAQKTGRQQFASYQNLGAYFLESLQGLTTLKLSGRDEERAGEFQKRTWSFRNATMRLLAMQLNSIILIDIIAYGGAAAGIITAAVSLERGHIAVSGAVVILFLAAEFFLPLRSLASYFHVAMGGVAAADKIFAVLQTPHPRRLHSGNSPHPSRLSALKLEQVSFSYTGRQQTLQGLNMEVQAGKTTAVVGPSGCGKSTVAALLVHFIEPDTGRVLLNGRDIKNIPVDELRSTVCLIPQNTYIFTGTVADNLKMARADASEAQMLEACAAAGLLDFVQSSPGGLHTEVGEAGARLSGGQKQKLGIARALLLDAGLYIFDEATSNVDVESEEEIWQAIWNITREKTVLIISHRLSTVIGADRIYVMDQGRIQAWGRHEQLMAQGGLYHRLAVEQGELVKDKVIFHEKRSGCL